MMGDWGLRFGRQRGWQRQAYPNLIRRNPLHQQSPRHSPSAQWREANPLSLMKHEKISARSSGPVQFYQTPRGIQHIYFSIQSVVPPRNLGLARRHSSLCRGAEDCCQPAQYQALFPRPPSAPKDFSQSWRATFGTSLPSLASLLSELSLLWPCARHLRLRVVFLVMPPQLLSSPFTRPA